MQCSENLRQQRNKVTLLTSKAEKESGRIFIVSAPSGAGKTTLCNELREKYPDIIYSVSYTTRNPRGSEKNGVEYFFISKDEFEKGIAENRWAEYALVHDSYYYGTSAEFMNKKTAEGKHILLDIDVQGKENIVKMYPDAVTIFIYVSSLEVLRERLESRGEDSPGEIEKRIKSAERELEKRGSYTYQVENDIREKAVAEFIDIFEKYM